MTLFYTFAGFMLVIAIIALILPFFRRSKQTISPNDRQIQNVDIAKQRLTELKTSLDNQDITEDDFKQAREELETRLAVDITTEGKINRNRGRWISILILLAVPLAAGSIYFKIGTPGAIDYIPQQAALHDEKLPPVKELIERVKERLAQTPDDPTGWFVLARTYMVTGQYSKSVEALKRLRTLVGDDPLVLVRLADAMTMAQGGQFSPESIQLIQKALKLQPEQPQGLWLMGVVESRRNNYKTAINYWEQAKKVFSSDPKSITELDQLIANATKQLTPSETESTAQTQTAAEPATVTANTAQLAVTISLSEKILAQTKPDDIVFIFATAQNGPRVPLAAVRKTVRDLPITIMLDDSQSMSPAFTLSSVDAFSVTARISKSGKPAASSGDFFGKVENLVLGKDTSTDITIDQQVP